MNYLSFPNIRPFQGVMPCIHPLALIAPSAIIIGDVMIGMHTSVGENTTIDGTHGPIIIGDYSNIQHNTVLLGRINIGNYTSIGCNCILRKSTVEDFVIISDGLQLSHSIIRQYSIIESECLVLKNQQYQEGLVLANFHLARAITDEEKQLIEYKACEVYQWSQQHKQSIHDWMFSGI